MYENPGGAWPMAPPPPPRPSPQLKKIFKPNFRLFNFELKKKDF